MRKFTVLVVTISTLLISCEKTNTKVEHAITNPESSIEEKIANQLANDSNCEDSPEAPNCQLVEISSAKTTPTGEDRILVLDFGGLLPSVTSYRKRVFSHLSVDESGQYRETTSSIKIPLGASIILHDIIGGSSKSWKASSFSAEVSLAFEEKYGRSMEHYLSDHGTWSFTLLAEYAPTASFALAPALKIPNDMLCSLDFDRIQSYVNRSSSSLKSFIIDQKIEYINLSAGESIPYYQKVWPQICPGSHVSQADLTKLLSTTATYYKALASIPGVTLVQAGINDDVSAESYPIDCDATAYPNRIRANYVTVVDSKIDPKGFASIDTKTLIDPINRNSIICNDVYINAGFDDSKRPFLYGEAPLMVTDTGLGTYRYPSKMVTSFAAPVTTAFALYLRHKFLGQMKTLEPQIPDRIRKMMNSDLEAIVQDPLKHKLFHQFK